MKNRAKCKICKCIIESFYRDDYVTCECGEIAVEGGTDFYKVIARDFSNFLRIDDEGNEIVITVKEEIPLKLNQKQENKVVKNTYDDSIEPSKPNKEELLKMLDRFIESLEKLPTSAMSQPVTHYDLLSTLLLISSILRS